MIWAIWAVVTVLTILTVRFPFSVQAYINLFGEDLGKFSIRILGFSVFSAKIKLQGGKLLLIDKKNKTTVIKISADKDDKNSLASHLDNAFFTIADIRTLDIYITIGKSDDAFSTAMAVAGTRVVLSAALALLRSRYPRIGSVKEIAADFDGDTLSLAAKSAFYLSVSDILYSFAYAWIRKIRHAAKRRKGKALRRRRIQARRAKHLTAAAKEKTTPTP